MSQWVCDPVSQPPNQKNKKESPIWYPYLITTAVPWHTCDRIMWNGIIQKGRGTTERIRWSPSRECRFIVRSFDQNLTSQGINAFLWRKIWKTQAPLKAAFFVCTASLGNILTIDNLRCRLMILDCCCMCKKNGEMVDHAPNCEVAKTMWSDFFFFGGNGLNMARKLVDS